MHRAASLLIALGLAVGCSDKDGDSGHADSSSSGTVSCESFCSAVNEACPSDTACLHSCTEEAVREPTRADQDCANAASTCEDTNACFSALF